MIDTVRLYDRNIRLDIFPAELRAGLAELAPWLSFGPNYRRGIADDVATAVRMYRDGRNDEGRYWVEQALAAGPSGVQP